MRMLRSDVRGHHSSPAKAGKLTRVADGWRCQGVKAPSGPSWGSEFLSHLKFTFWREPRVFLPGAD